MMTVLDEAGFPSVVATNCAQTYRRYLRHGELLSLRAELTDVSGPKRTALGEGWFVTTRNTWYSGDEPVAEMDWRVLKFRPRAAASKSRRSGSKVSLDPARLHQLVRRCGRRCPLTPRSSGPVPGPASCASSAAANAARCATRPARPASAAEPCTIRATRSPPGPARSTATWCTSTRRCPASSCRSSSRWSS